MVERADAVIVGGGLGGLAAGVALAGQGRRTGILEQHAALGGYAKSFQARALALLESQTATG